MSGEYRYNWASFEMESARLVLLRTRWFCSLIWQTSVYFGLAYGSSWLVFESLIWIESVVVRTRRQGVLSHKWWHFPGSGNHRSRLWFKSHIWIILVISRSRECLFFWFIFSCERLFGTSWNWPIFGVISWTWRMNSLFSRSLFLSFGHLSDSVTKCTWWWFLQFSFFVRWISLRSWWPQSFSRGLISSSGGESHRRNNISISLEDLKINRWVILRAWFPLCFNITNLGGDWPERRWKRYFHRTCITKSTSCGQSVVGLRSGCWFNILSSHSCITNSGDLRVPLIRQTPSIVGLQLSNVERIWWRKRFFISIQTAFWVSDCNSDRILKVIHSFCLIRARARISWASEMKRARYLLGEAFWGANSGRRSLARRRHRLETGVDSWARTNILLYCGFE